jgi:D-3-phosphoglycerate dehydrogenase
MKIVVADDLPPSAVALLAAEDGWTVDAAPGRSPSALASALGDADALIVRSRTNVDVALLASAPALRIVARAGTGVDNVDVAAATARGILVVNAPGANSVSVAEHACALLLALARGVPAADRAMKDARWDKKAFLGTELRGKTLGLAGLGHVGQEVAARARAFGMRLAAHDPFIAPEIAANLGVRLVSLDQLCEEADYLTLHLPSTPSTRHLFDDERFRRCKRGVRFVNTARGDLVDEAALRRAIESGIVAGAALDVFESEPPVDWSLARLPQVVATPHIAASTGEAQELVGLETAEAVRDFLRHGQVRNAVNFPSLPADPGSPIHAWIQLADRLGALAAQLAPERLTSIGVRVSGDLATGSALDVLAAGAAAGVLRPILSGGVTIVNARSLARTRNIDVVQSCSSRPREYTSLLSVRVGTTAGERQVEGTVFEPGSLRLVSIGGIPVEAPLSGTLLVVENDDRPGVIGDVGSILGRHAINIASFALGREHSSAIGIVNVDERPEDGPALERAAEEIRRAPGIRRAWVIRL